MDTDAIKTAFLSDPGNKRDNNEDSVLSLPGPHVFAVADGMGGVAGGEVASRIVVETIRDRIASLPAAKENRRVTEKVRCVDEALQEANRIVLRTADTRKLRGLGSTVVVAIFDGEDSRHLVVLHVGDSRAYRFHDGQLRQITHDHSVAEATGVNEADLITSFRGKITRAVGIAPKLAIEHTAVTLAGGDLVLLCSDGLTRMVADEKIQALIAAGGHGDLSLLARDLVRAANQAGGDDNVTVVIARVVGSSEDATLHGDEATLSAGALSDSVRTEEPTRMQNRS